MPAAAKDLLLILARDLAANVSTPTYLVDAEGTLVFFNEAAEELLGQTFQATGELTADEMVKLFQPQHSDGRPMAMDEIPITAAIRHRKPQHGTLGFTGVDGVRRSIQATAVPLLAGEGRLAGGLAVFWEKPRA